MEGVRADRPRCPARDRTSQAGKLSFRDAMIVQAAAESGSDVLWTEDLSDRQMVKGARIRNPLASNESQEPSSTGDRRLP